MTWFDGAVAAALVGTGCASLMGRDLFRSVVLFIVLGAFLALAWVRLAAPDVALAEVALGAGLTGALLLRAVKTRSNRETPARDVMRGPRWLATPAALGLGLAAVAALVSLPAPPPNLRDVVTSDLAGSGASNPVTAVLLNFRAWDTLLEVSVLVVALVSARAIAPRQDAHREVAPDVVLQTLSRILVPVSFVVAGHLLWKGSRAPGGAFQAGAVLAGAGVIAVLAGHAAPERWKGALTRSAVLLGPGVFLIVGVLGWLARGSLLSLAPERAPMWILLIESAATISIGAALLGLFLAASGRRLGAEETPR